LIYSSRVIACLFGMSGSAFEQLFDVSPFPAVVSRLRDRAVLAINKRTSEMFGIGQDEAIGLVTTDYYVNPADRELLTEPLARDGTADDVLLQLRRRTGETFWVRASARLVTWNAEPAVLTVFNDISEQLEAEQALRQSEQRLAAQSGALTAMTARHADVEDSFDRRLRSILETAAATLDVERISLWRFADERAAIECVNMFLRTPRAYQSGARLLRAEFPSYFTALERERVIVAHDAASDARTRDFASTYLVPNDIRAMLDVPLRQGQDISGVLCIEHVGTARTWTLDEQNFAVSTANLIAVAIADQRRYDALARVEESDRRAHMILDSAHDAFVGMDSRGTIVTWNAQAERTFGWRREEAVGRALADTIIPQAFREAHIHGMQRFHATGEAPVVNKRLELRGLHRDGHEFPIEITITSPMPAEHGYLFGAFLRDISDRRERDDQLRRAKEAAEAATQAKSQFLANMSHELRTPLNGVIGYAQLLQRDRTLTPAQREGVDAIAKCGSHLLELINDVLDLSKIEAGHVEIEESATDLVRLTTDVQHVIADAARRKGLRLTMAFAPDVPRHVLVDGRHLRQILLNLLGNAVKFTTRGEVRLGVARSEDGRLAFEVTDTGPGIEPEELNAIFEAFTQTRSGAEAGGTGLGLTISQHLLRRMRSELKVASVLGEGSRFFFSLPLVRVLDEDGTAATGERAQEVVDARLAPGQDFTALVVDDSTVSRRMLASLLEMTGFRVITATGGLEGIEFARRHHPSVIFMDVRMADLDGFSATRRLADDPETAGIPVIAVTASAFGDTRQAARDAGCAAYLPKPVRAEALFAVLQAHLGVEFVRTNSDALRTSPPSGQVPPDPQLAARIEQALSIGAVSDLEALANELLRGDTASVVIGQELSRLVARFDFDGLGRLAATLGRTPDRDGLREG
jgi:PAS domain S-box-containing protein